VTTRARIVCTLGPATHDPEAIRALLEAGMDVARLNFSHGTHEEHAELYRMVRAASDASGRAVGILADLQGPKIRLGAFAHGPVTLETGAEFTITTEPCAGDATRAGTTYEALARDVRAGDTLLIDDGLVRLEAIASDGRAVRCRVIEGGPVSDHKGINLPGVQVSVPPLTPKDLDDLRFALGLRVDLVALSFVRSPGHAEVVRREMDAIGARLPLIAKLEKPEAVANLEGIVAAFDGLMVARGDLGVEMPLEQVPLVQKRAIEIARRHAKPVIVATQMLDSMIHHSRPTRAEASDVANAVLDGADALMLSGETSTGDHPVESVATMARIIAAAEGSGGHGAPFAHAPAGRAAVAGHERRRAGQAASREEAIATAAAQVARDLHALALVAFTQTGSTARCLASHRQPIPLLAFTTEPVVRSQLALTWGVETFIVPRVDHTDGMIAQVDRGLLELGRGRPGDVVVIVAGTPPGTAGSTNTLRVHRLGG
jgi:pyruvate kinase